MRRVPLLTSDSNANALITRKHCRRGTCFPPVFRLLRCHPERSEGLASRLSYGSWILTSFFLLVTYHSSSITALHAQNTVVPQSVVTTIAGNGRILRGVGGLAKTAAMGVVYGVVADSAGNVFVSDATNNQVVRISTTGVLTLVAGNGFQGFSGDGGPARNAALNSPGYLAVDANDNIYIADTNNNRVRRVSSDGIITTVAGNGQIFFSGDGGPARDAAIWTPIGLAVDRAGNLYIADSNNSRIRKVNSSGVISTVAGNGNFDFSGDGGPATAASLNLPWDVAVDRAGNLYIADSNNCRIRKVTPDGTITTVAGNGDFDFSGDGGPATRAAFNFPAGVALDAAGNLYVSDTGNARVRRVNANQIITTVAGADYGFYGDGGPATEAWLLNPLAVNVDSAGVLYFADSDNGRVRRVGLDGIISTYAGTGKQNFSGDFGLSRNASLSQPAGIVVDASGNIYIADTQNHRIRKVTSSGIITTIAGNGIAGFSGDGGPAVNAELNQPNAIVLDATGALYVADTGNQRIRKIDSSGIINTIAGNGNYGFSGDNGPATMASMRDPSGVAVDGLGQLYIADMRNHRIRKVSPAGTITTVAGNGVRGFGGDGGPAISSSLNNPMRVAFDRNGNLLYIVDSDNYRIRRMSPNGIITTFAGNGVEDTVGDDLPAIQTPLSGPRDVAVDSASNVYLIEVYPGRIRRVSPSGAITRVAGSSPGFSGDGGSAINAEFELPRGIALDAAGNLYIADTDNDRIRMVLAIPPSLSAAPATLSFRAPAGTGAQPPKTVAVSSSLNGLLWSAQSFTQTGGDWLSISPPVGTAGGNVAVSTNASSLQPGNYQGSLTIANPGASPPTVAVSVNLSVDQPIPGKMEVDPGSLTFEVNFRGGNPAAQLMRITNAGSGSLNWTAEASTTTGGNWLSISASSGIASSTAASTIQINANVGDLAVGTYSGAIRIQSSTTNETFTTPVTLLVSQSAKILLSQQGLLFTGVASGGTPPSQNFGVLNIGQGEMNWTAQAIVLSGNNWLSVSPAIGSILAGSLDPPLVDVNVSVEGLAAGQYSGQIRVDSPGANNSPQFITVTLNVLPPGSNAPVVVRPAGLTFIRQVGTSSPGSQEVRLATATAGNVQVTANPSTFSGGNWLDVRPRNLVVSSANPRTLTVQPILGSLGVGQYSGTITLLFSDLTSQTVNVLFVVTPAVGSRLLSAGREISPGGDLEDCVPERLFLVAQSMGNNFNVPVGYPSLLLAQVKDNCDTSILDATVVASFDNGDSQVRLNSIGGGFYQASWQPGSAGQQNRTGPVRVTVQAARSGLAQAQVVLNGQLTSGLAAAPVLNSGGIVNAASYGDGDPVAPGSIISVFGLNLATSSIGASVLPLPTRLADATLTVGGQDVPLFYSSDRQINAQLPYELPLNSRMQAYVRLQRPGGGQTASVPETLTIVEVRPGIFTTNQQGTGQGTILNQNFSANSPTNPAPRGSVVQIFATGLGATIPAVPSGQAAPSSPPALAAQAVGAQIGDRQAAVQFAGLAPGFVGLYQVNVQIPTDAPTGPSVNLTLFQNGVPSNTVTVAVQ